MRLDDASIEKILLDQYYVTAEDIKKAHVYAAEHRGSVLDYLLAENLVSTDLLGQAVAESFGIAYADLSTHPVSKEQVLRIPEEIARKFRVVLFEETKKGITVATDDPQKKRLGSGVSDYFSYC